MKFIYEEKALKTKLTNYDNALIYKYIESSSTLNMFKKGLSTQQLHKKDGNRVEKPYKR